MNAEALSVVTTFIVGIEPHRWDGRDRARPTDRPTYPPTPTIETSSPGGITGCHGFFRCASQ